MSGSPIRSLAVITLVVPAIVATVALPAYADQTVDPVDSSFAAVELQRERDAQSVPVAAAEAVPEQRDGYDVTSAAELRRAAQRTSVASGPSIRAFLANPPYPSFDLNQLVQVALQYQGVPYVYGGSTPAGFDCSGLTAYVYAQFGVALPHSSRAQGSGGIPISPADALPGDIVAMDNGGHVGIYLGGNTMIDAPYPGKTVQVRTIYNPNHWFVRYGA
ncbi:MAG: C40 family peptidase [Micrococcales bacterium]|nr:C40 family peptidase [Micrococcales bacterium]OJX69854.1 MAG: hypothetical protein BGO94_15465 [Micrococcales bacterium 72-143]